MLIISGLIIFSYSHFIRFKTSNYFIILISFNPPQGFLYFIFFNFYIFYYIISPIILLNFLLGMDALLWFKDRFLAAPTLTSITIYLLYYAYICAASLLLPANIVDGHPNPKRGPRLKYSINGFKLTCLTILLMILFGGIVPTFSPIKLYNLSILAD